MEEQERAPKVVVPKSGQQLNVLSRRLAWLLAQDPDTELLRTIHAESPQLKAKLSAAGAKATKQEQPSGSRLIACSPEPIKRTLAANSATTDTQQKAAAPKLTHEMGQ